MPVLRLSDILTFFILIAVLLSFAAIWTIISERRRGVLRREIKKLKAQIELYERERFKLLDKVRILENSQMSVTTQLQNIDYEKNERELAEARIRIDSLESENAGLKRELDEAKLSLQEVYKALS